MSAKNKHPKEHLIHNECYIEIERCEKAWGMTDGYNIFIIEDFTDDILIEEWERLGEQFQDFLASNGLSSHMWVVAQR